MAESTQERLLTPALLAFLLAVGGVVAWAIATRHPTPDLEGCVELLADGDLDRDERERILLRTIDLAADDQSVRGRVAGYLAALALQDRGAFARLDEAIGPSLELPPSERGWLDLGDPLLRNVLAARLLESGGDVPAARSKWAQVAQQARMVGNGLAGELSAAAVDRLR